MNFSRSSALGRVAYTACVALAVGLASAAQAQTTKERILESGTIVIGIHNRSPWGFRQEGTGELVGWHPDVLRAAFADVGVRKVDFQITELGALIPGLVAGRFDAVASGLSITPERCQQVAFGEPDLKSEDAAIVLAGNPKGIHGYQDIAAKPDITMGGGRGSVAIRNAAAEGVPDDRMLQFPDVESNIAALRAGRTDAALFSSPTVIGLLAGNKSPDLERAFPFKTGPGATTYIAVAFRKADGDLRELYNQGLAKRMADGTIDKIMATYGFGASEKVPAGVATSELCAPPR